MMEHMSKFLQVGSSKVVFSQLRFIQPNDDWFSLGRYKNVETKLSQVIESKLPEITSMKPGAMESVSGDLTVEDVKVTYNMRKRSNLPTFVIQARKDEDWATKDTQDKSVGKFKDYGGMFERKSVLRSELVVSIRRLTASEMAQHTKVQNSQTSRSSPRGISSYFQPAEVQRPKTPEEKAALKRLLDRREAKKRHLSSSDSESNSASENLFEAPKSKQHHDRKRPVLSNRDEKQKDSRVEAEPKRFTSLSQPAPEKNTRQATASREDRIAATQVSKPPSATSRDKSSSARSDSGHHDRVDVRHKDDSNKSKASSSHRDKEKSKSHESTSNSARSTSLREREHKSRSDQKDSRSKDVAASQSRKTEKEPSKPSRSDGKERESSTKERSSKHREKRHHSPPKESRREEKSSKGSSRERTSKAPPDKPKESKVKTTNIKQLLTDCGIDDSDDDSNGEEVSRKKMRKGQEEMSRRSPDSTQLVDVIKPVAHSSKSSSVAALKRESLEDFNVGKETLRASSAAVKKQKPTAGTLCKSLFLEEDEDSDDNDDDKGKRRQPSKSPATEDDAVATDAEKETAQRSPLVADMYEPTPVVKLATDAEQRLPSKPVATNASGLDDEIIRLTRTPPSREPYAPSYRRTPTTSEAFSYNPSSPMQQDDRRKRKETGFEYIPSSIGSSSSSSSAAKPSRGRYEEYVPEAINRSARHHQSTVDYVPTYIPTPKKEMSTDVSTTTTTRTSPSLASEAPESSRPRSGMSLSRQAASKLEQEIRDTRNIKDLDKRHIEYLFIKNLPDLDGIIRRKVKSWRSSKYRKGGKEKRLLTFQVYTSPFLDSQMDFITKLFTEEFLLSRTVDGDYLNQVLIPEFLIRVFMANKGTTHEESDRLMAQMLSSTISTD